MVSQNSVVRYLHQIKISVWTLASTIAGRMGLVNTEVCIFQSRMTKGCFLSCYILLGEVCQVVSAVLTLQLLFN